MQQYQKHSPNIVLIMAVIMVFLIPTASLFLAFIFHNDVILDKPKVVEESIKSVVSLFISLSCLFASDALSRKVIIRKTDALKNQVLSQLIVLKDVMNNIINIPALIDESILENSSVEAIRANHVNIEKFKKSVQQMTSDMGEIYRTITSADPEIGKGCSDYSTILYQCIVAMKNFISLPTAANSEKIKLLIRGLFSYYKI